VLGGRAAVLIFFPWWISCREEEPLDVLTAQSMSLQANAVVNSIIFLDCLLWMFRWVFGLLGSGSGVGASHHTVAPFNLSFEDFRRYFSCPKKVAFRVLGVKAYTFSRVGRPVIPPIDVGRMGERLTEEMLELIAQVQEEVAARRGRFSRAEVVEALGGEDVEGLIGEAMDWEEELGEEEGEEAEVGMDVGEVEGRRVVRSFRRHIMDSVRLLAEHLPRILSFTRPRYRNRDVFAVGFPDFQVETDEGHFLVEVKSVGERGKSEVGKAVFQTKFYLAMLEDSMVSDSLFDALDLVRADRETALRLLGVDRLDSGLLREMSSWAGIRVPPPPRGLVFLPRQGHLEVVERGIEGFRSVAAEIWKIKRAALVEGVLPHVEPSEVCRRCPYRRHCEEGESLEPAVPAPLVFASAEAELEEAGWDRALGESRLEPLMERMRREAGAARWELYEYFARARMLLSKERRLRRMHALYREFPDWFDRWGGEAVAHDPRLAQAAHTFYRTRRPRYLGESGEEESLAYRYWREEVGLLRRVRRRWRL